MMQWALAQRGIHRFLASIAPGNVASRALATRLGFVPVGRQIDATDEPEDVFLHVLAAPDITPVAGLR